jgi:hypothetical protein
MHTIPTFQQDDDGDDPTSMQLGMMEESSTDGDFEEFEDGQDYLIDLNDAVMDNFPETRSIDNGSEDGSIDFKMEQTTKEYEKKENGQQQQQEEPQPPSQLLTNLGGDMFVDASDGSSQGSFGLSLLEAPLATNTLDLGNSVSSSPPLVLLKNTTPTEDHHQKTIRFAQVIATPIGETTHNQDLNITNHSDDNSIDTLDIFDQGGGTLDGHHSAKESSNGSLESSFADEEDDADSEMSAHDEDEEDKKIRRQLLYAAGGAGLMGLMGWAGKHVLQLFDKVRISMINRQLYLAVVAVLQPKTATSKRTNE